MAGERAKELESCYRKGASLKQNHNPLRSIFHNPNSPMIGRGGLLSLKEEVDVGERPLQYIKEEKYNFGLIMDYYGTHSSPRDRVCKQNWTFPLSSHSWLKCSFLMLSEAEARVPQ